MHLRPWRKLMETVAETAAVSCRLLRASLRLRRLERECDLPELLEMQRADAQIENRFVLLLIR